MQGGVTTDRIVHGKLETPIFNEESSLGFDRFRVSWRDASNDQAFIDYVRSKYPRSLANKAGLDPFVDFTSDPGGFLNFNYDAVTALGLAMCLAGDNQTFFTGTDIYSQFRQLDFDGASGNVRILPDTGTRDYTSITFVMWNIQASCVDADGNSTLEYVPTHKLERGQWYEILGSGNGFIFADGTTVPPESLPPIPFNFNYIGVASRAIGYTLMCTLIVATMASICWTVCRLHNRIVDSAQPLFLIVVSVGALIMTLAIVPLAFEETVTTNEHILNASCMAVPWLYFIGTSTAVSALLAKMYAVYKVCCHCVDLLADTHRFTDTIYTCCDPFLRPIGTPVLNRFRFLIPTLHNLPRCSFR
jgi:7 transmembrane sweet-taste receptor of 3 GCPR